MKCDCVFPSELVRNPQVKMGREKEYARWSNMLQRCYNPKNDSFKNYGGRGIRVCLQWQLNLQTYISDVGKRPEGMSLDRRENDGHYCPHNVQWATGKQQANNRRWSGTDNGLPRGVTKRSHKITKQFQSNIRVGAKLIHLGYFDTPEEAGEAYVKYKSEHVKD